MYESKNYKEANWSREDQNQWVLKLKGYNVQTSKIHNRTILIPLRLSLALNHLSPTGTWRTNVHPPPAIVFTSTNFTEILRGNLIYWMVQHFEWDKKEIYQKRITMIRKFIHNILHEIDNHIEGWIFSFNSLFLQSFPSASNS